MIRHKQGLIKHKEALSQSSHAGLSPDPAPKQKPALAWGQTSTLLFQTILRPIQGLRSTQFVKKQSQNTPTIPPPPNPQSNYCSHHPSTAQPLTQGGRVSRDPDFPPTPFLGPPSPMLRSGSWQGPEPHKPVLWVPVAAEDRSIVGCEHPLVAVGPADVPQLHIPVLKGGSKGEVVPDAELHVPHAL